MSKFLKIVLISVLAAITAFSLFACKDGNEGNAEKGILYKKSGDVYIVTGYNDDGETTELNVANALKEKIGETAGKVRIKAEAFKGNKSLTSIILPNETVEIDAGAFAGMVSLKSLTVPYIGRTDLADAYYGQTAKHENKSVDAERTIAHFFGADSYNAGYSTTINYGTGESTTTCYMPLTLREINVIPAKDNYVLPAYAFNGANILTKITLGDKVGEIGEYAFVGCSNLSTIEIPASVKTIYTGAFKGNTALKTISFKGTSTLEVIGASAFEGVGISEIAIPASVKTIGEGAFKNSDLVKVTLPANANLEVGNYAFYGCAELETVYTDGITEGTIGVYGFYDCESLVYFGVKAEEENGNKIDKTGFTVVGANAFNE